MMTLAKDKRAPVKNDLLHVRFDSTGTHAVNTPTNIQVRGRHIARRGATTRYSDETGQRGAGGPVPLSGGYRP
jgi:hypothetical protein